jgi:glutamine synthetase
LNILSELTEIINKKYKLFFMIGAELEFYASSAIDLNLLNSAIVEKFKAISCIKTESSPNQYEIVTNATDNIANLISDINELKCYLHSFCQRYNVDITFNSKPFLETSGSSIHINLTFFELPSGKIVDGSSIIFSTIIGGMCYNMVSSMLYFAPNCQSYRRYQYSDIYTPLFVTWGFNNRNTAIRVVTGKRKNFRIEHRVSCSDANIEEVIENILISAMLGIKNNTKSPKVQYGILQYSEGYRYKLPISFTEAKRYFQSLTLDLL